MADRRAEASRRKARAEVILLFPLLLVATGYIVARHRQHPDRLGGAWFALWTLAGATFTFSLLTGLSIGLFVFPFAAALVLWAARSAPGLEALGFVEGIGVALLIVALVQRGNASWLIAGLVPCSLAPTAYAVARLHASRS